MSEHADLPAAQHETRNVTFRSFFIGFSLLLLTLLFLALLARVIFPSSIRDKLIPQPLPKTALPALQASPRADMQALRKANLEKLESLYWIDRAHGIVHLPIDLAMRKVAKDGIPGWPVAAKTGGK